LLWSLIIDLLSFSHSLSALTGYPSIPSVIILSLLICWSLLLFVFLVHSLAAFYCVFLLSFSPRLVALCSLLLCFMLAFSSALLVFISSYFYFLACPNLLIMTFVLVWLFIYLRLACSIALSLIPLAYWPSSRYLILFSAFVLGFISLRFCVTSAFRYLSLSLRASIISYLHFIMFQF